MKKPQTICEDIDLDKLNKHAALMVIVYDLFTKTAQNKYLMSADDKGFTMALRMNLPKQQIENLVVKPLRSSLQQCDVTVDYDEMTLRISRRDKAKAAKSGRSANEAAA